ncbi:MAG: tRNA cyclic N6-threonylcarbamoyladenosine(37) synthase TcdA [Verrucomicrobiota bacterium]
MDENDYMDRFSGIGRLFGAEALEQLKAAHVCVVGIGGVGSWSAEALARSGVGRLTLIDLDDICVTNVNRQLHALDGEIGRTKVGVMAERIARIHPGCAVETREQFFTSETAEALLAPGFDFVLDAIDTVEHKALLIAECRKREIPVVTCGGAGGKRDATAIRAADLAQTTNDPLLKQVRKKLRREFGFPRDEKAEFGVRAIFSAENPVFPWADGSVCETKEPGGDLRLNCDSGFGTATFVTGVFGFAAAGEVVRLLG